jgi:hypothetical protein
LSIRSALTLVAEAVSVEDGCSGEQAASASTVRPAIMGRIKIEGIFNTVKIFSRFKFVQNGSQPVRQDYRDTVLF